MTVRERLRAAARSRPARRLAFAVAALVLFDRVEPAVLRMVEHARYTDPAKDFRFENSDLFGLGPLVAYLREEPREPQRRVLFLGNSMMFGYELAASDALPARYQRLDTSAKTFNAGINGLSSAAAYLIAKTVVDAVDLTYVSLGPIEGPLVPATFPALIPVDEADLEQYRLAAPNRVERTLSATANRWRLYRDAYRLQAALFGSSTRQYIYLNKGVFARSLIARLRAEQPPGAPAGETVTIETPMSDALPAADRQAQLRAERPELWQFGDLYRSRRKPVILLQMEGHSKPLLTAAIGDFNRVYAPYARVHLVRVPPSLTVDGMHMTAAATTQLARALWDARREDAAR